MKPTSRLAGCALAALLIAHSPGAALAAWPHATSPNLPVSTAANDQTSVVSMTDGAGGVFLAWADYRNGVDLDVFAQHISAAGTALWTANGINLTAGQTGNQTTPAICSDGTGGAIVAWMDARTFGSTTDDIYAQRVTSLGSFVWTTGGVAICNDAADQSLPDIAADGSGGAVLTWVDNRASNLDIYARRVNPMGFPLGAVNGTVLCNATGSQYTPKIVADGSGGGIVAWADQRSGSWDIYAQHFLNTNVVDPGWPANGSALTTSGGNQDQPGIVSDGAGGALVCWHDAFTNPGDIYMHHVLPGTGADPSWPVNGRVICGASGTQNQPAIVADGSGGAIVAWSDARGGSTNQIYAQHAFANGVVDPAWPSDGRLLSPASGLQTNPSITTDGAGGAIVAWADARMSVYPDLYAQHVQATGIVDTAWPADGRAIAIGPMNQVTSSIVADGAGGAIVSWPDDRAGANNSDVYCQRVARFGQLGSPEPAIAGIRDVSNDQGGAVNLAWDASWLDTAPSQLVDHYWILRALTHTAAQQAAAKAVPLSAGGFGESNQPGTGAILSTIQGTNTYYWELRTIVTALHFVQGYGTVVTTEGDSAGTYNPRTYFAVVAFNASGSQYWMSAPDSGYSVDNLSPAAPAGVSGQYASGASHLHWTPNAEADLAGYRLYSGSTPGFIPGPGNLVATPSDTGYVDASGSTRYYKLSAIDVHGNESGFTSLLPTGTLDAPGPGVSRALALSRPGPNPSSGALTLRFALPRETRVSLAVYDASGRRVRTLIDGVRPAGEQATGWDLSSDAGARVAGGLYFVRLQAEGRSLVERLAVIR